MLYGVEGTPIDTVMRIRGYRPMERCLLLCICQGERTFARNVKRNVLKIARRFGGMYTTGYAAKSWEHGRFSDPYMRATIR